ncbi:MAG: hypothetical protein ACODAU_00595 [Myxococcota bacterium]
MTRAGVLLWTILAASAVGLGCGGRSGLGIFDYEPPEGDAGPGAPDAAVDAVVPDAGPDAGDGGADAGPPLPFEGPLDVIGVESLATGDLRIITLRDAADSAGPLEIHGLNEETGEFELLCAGGDATDASRVRLPREPGEEPTATDERLLVEHSDCGRPPTCPQRELFLLDLECGAVGAPIEDAVTHAVASSGTIYTLDLGGDLHRWDAETGDSEVIATGVGALRFDGRETFWSVQDGELIRRDLSGEVTGRAGNGVRTYWLRTGTGEVAFADETGVHVWEEGTEMPWLAEAGACRPVYVHDALTMYSPCQAGALVVLDRERGDRFEVSDGVGAVPHAQWNDDVRQVAYAIDPEAPVGSSGPVAPRPWKDVYVFEPGEGSTFLASQAYIVRHLSQGRIGIVHDAMDDVGALSVWTGGSSLVPVATDVAEVSTGLPVYAALAEFDGSTGTLLAVDRDDFAVTPIATGVPRKAFLVGRPGPEMVYLRDVDPELGAGTLETFALAEGAARTVDVRVTPGFVRVAQPAPGGVVYAVYDGQRSDVRFHFFDEP